MPRDVYLGRYWQWMQPNNIFSASTTRQWLGHMLNWLQIRKEATVCAGYCQSHSPWLTKEVTGTLSMSVIMYHTWSTHTTPCARGKIFNQQLNADNQKSPNATWTQSCAQKFQRKLRYPHFPLQDAGHHLRLQPLPSPPKDQIAQRPPAKSPRLTHYVTPQNQPNNSWMHV